MGYFNRDGGGQSSSRGRSNFGRDDRGNRGGGFSRGGGDRQMHKTTCSDCGKDCEVPFRPTSGKPVYCSECFEKKGDRPERSDRSDRPSFNQALNSNPNSEQLEAINVKLDKLLKLLEPKVLEVVKPLEKEVVVKKEKVLKVKKEASKKKKV